MDKKEKEKIIKSIESKIEFINENKKKKYHEDLDIEYEKRTEWIEKRTYFEKIRKI